MSDNPQAEIEALRKRLAELEARTASTASGVSVNPAGDSNVGGDVVGRDKIFITINYNYAGSDLAQAQELIERYLRWVIDECAPLQLRAIDQGAVRPNQKPLGLTSVYVDLNTTFLIPEGFRLKDYLARLRSGNSVQIGALEKMLPVSVIDALASDRFIALSGKPGSGKSTFSLYLTLTLAQASLGEADVLQRLGSEWTYGPLLPVHVILRQFAESLSANLQRGRASHLWDFIAGELQRCGLTGRTGSLVQDVANKAGVFFLLDGLDEAGDEKRRQLVLEAMSEFMQTAGENSRFLLTARPYAWESGVLLEGIAPATYQLADFEPEQIQEFIARWYQAISAIGWVTASEANEKQLSLQNSVGRADLAHLANNPLLLTLMATLHTNRGRLPDDRVDLYNDVVELLLQRWNESTGADRGLLDALQTPTLKLADLREVIEQIAFEAHAANIGQEGTADITEADLLEAFRPLLGGSRDKAALVVEYIEKRAGLLLGQGVRGRARQFTFPHRTFQEYLAAGYLVGQADFGALAEKLATEASAHWREVLVLAARRARGDHGVFAVDNLIHAQSAPEYQHQKPITEADWRKAVLAAEQLLEIGLARVDSREQYRAIRDRVRGWLKALLENGALPVRERVYAGNILGQLGDPRFRADLYFLPDEPLLGFVEIPAGPFLMGTRVEDIPALMKKFGGEKNWYERETPQHTVELSTYYLARYPVTVAQFQAFAQASGYKPPDEDSLKGQANHPVVNVTWEDAVAYGQWLTEILKNSSLTPAPLAQLLHKNWQVTLPTEAQWEKAARGTDGRQFPWGHEFDPERANVEETKIGNVWEWCADWLDEKEYQRRSKGTVKNPIGPKNGAQRVRRGGAFYDDAGDARCARRLRLGPFVRDGSFGFRVGVAPFRL